MSPIFALRFIYMPNKSDFSLVFRVKQEVLTCRKLLRHEIEQCLSEAASNGLRECPFTITNVGKKVVTGWCIEDRSTGLYYSISSFMSMYIYAVRVIACFFAEQTYMREDVGEFEEYVAVGEMDSRIRDKMLHMFSLGYRSPVYIAWACCTGMDISKLHEVLSCAKTFTTYFGEQPA